MSGLSLIIRITATGQRQLTLWPHVQWLRKIPT